MPRRARSPLPCSGTALTLFFFSFFSIGCSPSTPRDPNSLIFLIESTPTNLDPRFATDGQSQRLDGLLFSSLVERDAQMNIQGDLAESWATPDSLTYIFHLRPNIKFHDGSPLTSADVKATFEYVLNSANKSPKRGAFRMIKSIEAPDPQTVIFHLTEPYASFLFGISRPAIGIVPANAGPDFSRHPIGSGPFRFDGQTQDEEVSLVRNTTYFRPTPAIQQVRFRVVPDAVVRALELRKGSADLEMSSLSADMVPVLTRQPALSLTERSGTNFQYLGINFQDSVLSHREVRQALAFATDREALVKYLLRDQARIATGILPPNHWAYDGNVAQYMHNPARAAALLESAGFHKQPDGYRIHLMLKTSTDDQARQIGAVLQAQWREAGIALELRPLELATLLSDSIRGNFQLTLLRWVGANNDPDVFEFVFSSKRFPPDGANRGRYRNPEVDALTEKIRVEMDQERRKQLCSELQKLLALDLPYVPLWFTDVVSVHRRELGTLALTPTGDYDFLATLQTTPAK